MNACSESRLVQVGVRADSDAAAEVHVAAEVGEAAEADSIP